MRAAPEGNRGYGKLNYFTWAVKIGQTQTARENKESSSPETNWANVKPFVRFELCAFLCDNSTPESEETQCRSAF